MSTFRTHCMHDEKNSSEIEQTSSLSFSSIFDELAEIGELAPFLEEYMNRRFGWDDKFRRQMIDALYSRSSEVIPQVERYLLEKMCESLSFFIEYTKLCQRPNLNP